MSSSKTTKKKKKKRKKKSPTTTELVDVDRGERVKVRQLLVALGDDERQTLQHAAPFRGSNVRLLSGPQ